MTLTLYKSWKVHIIIAVLISVWLVAFLVLIAPFDASDLSFSIRLWLMPFYGVISFLGYLVLFPFQNYLLGLNGKWSLGSEVLFLICYNIIVCAGSYAYYVSDIINGDYPFNKFVIGVFVPIFFVLLSIIIFLRWFLFKEKAAPTDNKIFIKGENKLDSLYIDQSDLVSISAADNYIEVSYIHSDALHKKLIRTTLKTIAQNIPKLVQTHRSHLINPSHFVEWKDSKTIIVHELEIPVTKTYKESVMELQNRP